MWYKFNLFIKRLIDIILGIIGLILLMPLLFIVSILIKLDSDGPIFFVQNRLTKDGKIFKMIKFRSMIVNAESIGSGLFNFENDPRVTKVGKFIRDTSIDELPQIINVLCGDISFVGPRPCVSYELGEYNTLNKKFKKRFEIKGGITGLAQVKGRNENSWVEKVELDNEYIDKFKRTGVFLDFKIIILTIFKVLSKNSIYEEKKDKNMSDTEAAKFAEEEIIRLAHLNDD